MGVKLAADILDGYKYRKRPLGSLLYFVVAFAEFRLDERQPELCVQHLFHRKGAFRFEGSQTACNHGQFAQVSLAAGAKHERQSPILRRGCVNPQYYSGGKSI